MDIDPDIFKQLRGNIEAIQREMQTPPVLFDMKPMPPSPILTSLQENKASEFYKRLTKWIEEFDASLGESDEVGVRLVSFGQSVMFRIRDMGYWDPSLISFSGVMDDGKPVELIQHVSQISILLMK